VASWLNPLLHQWLTNNEPRRKATLINHINVPNEQTIFGTVDTRRKAN
jgi:hypothetical protein